MFRFKKKTKLFFFLVADRCLIMAKMMILVTLAQYCKS